MSKIKRKYYIAYGSNLDVNQMLNRCPDAIKIGSAVIEDYELLFRGNSRNYGVATIEPCEGKSVPVGIWAISERDEQALDWYEGYPRLYIKKPFKVTVRDKRITAMAYIMTPGHKIAKPSPIYLRTIERGYKDFDFDADVLMQAAKDAEKEVKKNVRMVLDCPKRGGRT